MRVLVVASHPDDDAIGCGGAIINHVQQGYTVGVLYLTSGERGCPGLSVEESIEIRESEAKASNAAMGSEILGFWHLPDGNLTYSVDLRNRLIEQIKEFLPDTIYVTHEKESHADHRVAAKLVRESVKELNFNVEVLFTEVWTPMQRTDRVLCLAGVAEKKMEAVQLHKSQVERGHFDEAALALARYRGIMQGRCEYAEVYNRMREGDGMRITVALLTYAPSVAHPRAEYARKTLESTIQYLDPGDNTLHFHIADDGSDPQHVELLRKICQNAGYEPSVTNSERGGYGKSYNLMMQAVHSSSDLIMPLEDDWELTRPLKLEYLAKALDENPDIRSIRLGYLGITQPLLGTVAFRSGMTYLLLDPNSPEPHVFCGHPRIETVEYQRDVGAWPEGLRAGETEWEVTHRWSARTGVAWPLDIGLPASQDWGAIYAHIGSVSFNQDIPEGAHA